MMRGIIIGISNRNDFVALQTEVGYFSIFENTSGDNFEVENELIWNGGFEVGDCFLKNISEGETSEVYFQYHGLKDINEVKRILNS